MLRQWPDTTRWIGQGTGDRVLTVLEMPTVLLHKTSNSSPGNAVRLA